MNLEDYQASMDEELRTGFARMLERYRTPTGAQPDRVDLAGRRRQVAEFAAAARKALPPSDRIRIEDRRVTASAGAPDVPVRLYSPIRKREPLPAVVWIHGGGFTLGNPDQDEAFCRQLVEEIGGIVVSVDHRLAPEDPFPAPLDDCYAALRWVNASAEDLGVDGARVAVAGASSGGNLAAGVALLARDRKEITLAFQLLIYACLDNQLTTSSSREIAAPGMIGNRDDVFEAWRAYLGNTPECRSPYAVPARADRLAGLPPTYIMTGELDVVRDEDIEYATRLMQSGVSTELHVYPGAFHGFDRMVPTAAISRRATAECLTAFKEALTV